MKRLSLIALALLTLLLAQCKKEKIDNTNNTDVKKVKVRCEVPMGNSGKTDLTGLITDGVIKWSTGTERIYLAVNHETNPQIVELTATTTVPGATSLAFEGEVPENVISTTETYDVWYFGNSQNLEEGSYVSKTESNGVITKIDGSIATQSGNIEDLGYHHIAKGTANAQTASNGDIVLNISDLDNQMAIAYMTLTGIYKNKINGSAIVGTSYSLEYSDGKYKFNVSSDDNIITIGNDAAPPQAAYVVFFPNATSNVDVIINIEERSYRFNFKDGIKANSFYYKSISEEGVEALKWTERPNFENGYEYVDLGLSVKWAKYNIGVNPADLGKETTTEEDYYGDYYVWRNVVDITQSKDFSLGFNEYDYDFQGEEEYDAATYQWGDYWMMPQGSEMKELVNNCTWTEVEGTEENNFEGVIGLTGWIATSKINGKSIFFPGAGYYDNGLTPGFEQNGRIYYYTSTWNYDMTGVPGTQYTHGASVLKYDLTWGEGITVTKDYAIDGRSIRPVYKLPYVPIQ